MIIIDFTIVRTVLLPRARLQQFLGICFQFVRLLPSTLFCDTVVVISATVGTFMFSPFTGWWRKARRWHWKHRNGKTTCHWHPWYASRWNIHLLKINNATVLADFMSFTENLRNNRKYMRKKIQENAFRNNITKLFFQPISFLFSELFAMNSIKQSFRLRLEICTVPIATLFTHTLLFGSGEMINRNLFSA